MGYYEARIEDAVFVVRAEQQDAALGRMPGSWVLFHSGTTDRWRYVFDGGVDRRTEEPRPWYGR